MRPILGTRLAALLALVAAVALAAPARAQDPLGDPLPDRFAAAQLDELVAPIALYPDVVLDSLLPATTTPDDVSVAARWVAMQGGAAVAAPVGVAWNPAVVALLQYPDVLRWLEANRGWVDQMGWAMAIQPEDVLEAIQRYRWRARELGVLATNDWQRVSVVQAEPPYIVIEPAVPDLVYVPVYDPWPILQPGWVYRPTYSFYVSWWSFHFGGYGPWSWHEISWPHLRRGVWIHNRPWWWNRWRGRAADWSVSRPQRWTVDRDVFISRSSRPRFGGDATITRTVVRPRLAVDVTDVTRRDLRDRVMVRRESRIAPPEVRPDVRRRLQERIQGRVDERRREATFTTPGTATPRVRVSQPPTVTPIPTPTPRVTPRIPDRVRERLEDPRRREPVVQPPAATTPRPELPRVPRATSPPARRLPPAAERPRSTVLDRDTIDAFTRRGRASLERRARAEAPKAETPRAPEARERGPKKDPPGQADDDDDEEEKKRRRRDR